MAESDIVAKTAWFDHTSPEYGDDASPTMTKYDGTTGVSYNGHNGIDYATGTGVEEKDILAAAKGVVKKVEWQNPNVPSEGYGFYVRLWHSDYGQSTLYAHATTTSILVSVNDQVVQGQHIAESGNTGDSSGPHLHFSVFDNDSHITSHSIDPFGWSGNGKTDSRPSPPNPTFQKDPWPTIPDKFGYLWTTDPPSTSASQSATSWNLLKSSEGWAVLNGADDWGVYDDTIASPNNDKWVLDPKLDPQIESPQLSAITASQYPTVEIKFSAQGTGQTDTCRVYFSKVTPPSFNENDAVNCSTSVIKDGTQRTYTANLASDPDYTGTITAIRIDPIANGDPNASTDLIFIDHIKFSSNSWTYEQTFNTLNNGDLNNQDSWSGDVEYDVQSTITHEGAKAIQVNALGTSKLISRTVQPFTSGQVYFSVRRDTNSVGYFGVYLRNSTAGHIAFIYFKPDGNISAYEGAAQTERVIGTYIPNTWYRIGIDYSASTDQYRVNINNGAWSPYYAAVAATTEINQILFYADNYANSYLDFVGPNYSATPPSPPDTIPPVITNVSSSNVTSNSATITWTTDETSTSQVEYGPTTAYGFQTPIDLTPVISHSVNLANLSLNTLYHYRVKSKDASNNEAISADYTFTTLATDWTYEQTFNTLNNGDLNGQDSWSGAAEYDVQTSITQEGAKAVKVNAISTSKLIERTVPSFTSGQVYFSVRRDTNSVGYFGFYLRNSTAGHIAFIYFKPDGNISAYEGAAQTERVIGTYIPNTWYRIGIDYSASTDQYRVNINNGAWSPYYAAVAATTEINQIKLYADSNANSYLDFVGPGY